MKIGILVREETMQICTGKGCLNAFLQRKDSFARYDEELELLAFTHTGGDLNRKIKNMIQSGIEGVHLSSCLRARSPDYASLLERLSEHFTVVGYTHGPEVRIGQK
ncbi:CGGC domain-containing protein [Desulfosporosinus orientis DSM 765]|uniref:CGGC domain-containing protein n=1 Tax=Desulfosporosinus orientis (strain ATCC 19365 / DSM 765 / NCIMB 8382 / VKM B-1628 / Singapore I) TaxID=768706 RepID=G7W6S4_DESOD|nr:CGGC domain-containing protein [Desulfosporosinus orientis]AET69206.1 CGGC domain-containing protein [Desulfosporosinus orientis DSM 765]